MRVNNSDFSRAAVFDCPPLRSSRVTGVYAHRYLLVLANGEPADPAAFVTANPQWNLGDPFTAGDGSRWRIVAIEPNLSDAAEFDALWTVEPLD